MANRVQNKDGLGKSVAFIVPTPMRPWNTWLVRFLLWVFTIIPSFQTIARRLSFLAFVHWVVVSRRQLPRLDPSQPKERLHYDYLFFLSTFNGPWDAYIDAYADVLTNALDAVWLWSVGYPSARQVTGLKRYIRHNQIEAEHHYIAHPGASVRDVRAALELRSQLEAFATDAMALDPQQFQSEFQRVLLRVQGHLGAIGTFPRPQAQRGRAPVKPRGKSISRGATERRRKHG